MKNHSVKSGVKTTLKTDTYVIRPALPPETKTLIELTIRSTAFWGRSKESLEGVRLAMEYNAPAFVFDWTYVLEKEGAIIGYYRLSRTLNFPATVDIGPKALTLAELYIDAPYIRKGYGTRLWNHAVELACKQGYREIVFRAELKAYNFYRHMGAKLIEDVNFGFYPNGCPYSARILSYSI